jgi:hypothetical protein
VYWDNGSNGVVWVSLVQELQGAFTFTHTASSGIVRSSQYKFYYLAINQQGVGAASAISTIEASSKPN